MPKVSINILTKDRVRLLSTALAGIQRQVFQDFEIIVIDDGSGDETPEFLKSLKLKNLKIITHEHALGIILSRQEALLSSGGEYIAILDDDDEWVDAGKLKKQVEFMDSHPEYVITGGGIVVENSNGSEGAKYRPRNDGQIRRTMLLRNNFFTSTVMFRKSTALQAGGFTEDGIDLAEDYDLWLRLGKLGKMYNFRQNFTKYRQSGYNKVKFRQFLTKQLVLIGSHRTDYPLYVLSFLILRVRLWFNS